MDVRVGNTTERPISITACSPVHCLSEIANDEDDGQLDAGVLEFVISNRVRVVTSLVTRGPRLPVLFPQSFESCSEAQS